jgi:hypothetical protein
LFTSMSKESLPQLIEAFHDYKNNWDDAEKNLHIN